MKKLIIIFLSLVLVFSAKSVFADYATSYQTYVNANGSYQSAYNDYLTARATYLASGSLDAQNKAQAATLKMLTARDFVVISYMNAIIAKITAGQGMSDSDKNSLVSALNTEVSWHQAHSNKLASAGSLDDLVQDSDEAKSEYYGATGLAVYNGLINLGIAENNFLRGEINNQVTVLLAKISEIANNHDKDVSSIQRSMVEVQDKISRSVDKDNAAKGLIGSIKLSSDQQSSNEALTTIETDLADSNSYLKEANQEMLQVILQIKTN